MYNTAQSEIKKVKNYQSKHQLLLENKDLVDYIISDYIVHNDRRHQSNVFAPALKSSHCLTIEDEFLSFQIIKTKTGNIVNFNWTSADILASAINAICQNYKIIDFYHYGKCGYLGSDKNAGDIVYPEYTKMLYSSDEVRINNCMSTNSDNHSKILCVQSALIKTKGSLVTEYKNGYNCIEMELYSEIASCGQKLSNHVFHYISDFPLGNIKLSHRLKQLPARIKSAKLMIDEIIKKYHD